jgi:hypothetical protein
LSLFVSSQSNIDRDTRQFRLVWEIISQSKSAARSIIISRQHRDIAFEQFVLRQEFFLVKHEERSYWWRSRVQKESKKAALVRSSISHRDMLTVMVQVPKEGKCEYCRKLFGVSGKS